MEQPEIVINPNDLTIDEIEEIEDRLDMSIDEAFAGRKGKAVRVVAWVVLRRTDPDITLEAVGKLKFGTLSFKADDVDPTDGSATATLPSSA